MLLYWFMDQYNNVQKYVERKEGAMLPDGREGLVLFQLNIFSFRISTVNQGIAQ